MPCTDWTKGDKATATLPCGTFTGVVEGFNPSGLSALIRLTAAAPGYPEGTSVPIPVRLLNEVA